MSVGDVVLLSRERGGHKRPVRLTSSSCPPGLLGLGIGFGYQWAPPGLNLWVLVLNPLLSQMPFSTCFLQQTTCFNYTHLKSPHPQRGSVGNALNQTPRDQKAVRGHGASKRDTRGGDSMCLGSRLCLQVEGCDSQPQWGDTY